MTNQVKNTEVSVIIPSLGVSPNLCAVLAGLSNQTLPPVEVIVVHSGEVPLMGKLPDLPSLKVIEVTKPLLAGEARNLGVEKSTAKFLLFLDDDCLPACDWVEKLVTQMIDQPNQVIVGSVGYQSFGDYWGDSLWLTEFSALLPTGTGRQVEGHGASCNLGCPRWVFHRIGGFHNRLATHEDSDFLSRCQSFGIWTYFSPSIRVRHCNQTPFRDGIRKMFRHGRGARDFRFPEPKYFPFTLLAAPLIGLLRYFRVLKRVLKIPAKRRSFSLRLLPGVSVMLMAWSAGFAVGMPYARRDDGQSKEYFFFAPEKASM